MIVISKINLTPIIITQKITQWQHASGSNSRLKSHTGELRETLYHKFITADIKQKQKT